jgi:hypothetical protein
MGWFGQECGPLSGPDFDRTRLMVYRAFLPDCASPASLPHGRRVDLQYGRLRRVDVDHIGFDGQIHRAS